MRDEPTHFPLPDGRELRIVSREGEPLGWAAFQGDGESYERLTLARALEQAPEQREALLIASGRAAERATESGSVSPATIDAFRREIEQARSGTGGAG